MTKAKINVRFFVSTPKANKDLLTLNSNEAADIACKWLAAGNDTRLFAEWNDSDGVYHTHQIPITTQRSTRKQASDIKKMILAGELV